MKKVRRLADFSLLYVCVSDFILRCKFLDGVQLVP
jgi:hypothetical protein